MGINRRDWKTLIGELNSPNPSDVSISCVYIHTYNVHANCAGAKEILDLSMAAVEDGPQGRPIGFDWLPDPSSYRLRILGHGMTLVSAATADSRQKERATRHALCRHLSPAVIPTAAGVECRLACIKGDR